MSPFALILFCCTLQVFGEILKNGGFEIPLSNADWDCWGYSCTLISDSFQGSSSLLVSSRSETWQGPFQKLPLGPNGGNNVTVGRAYAFSGYVKLLYNGSAKGQWLSITLEYELQDGTKDWQHIASLYRVLPSNGWQAIAGSFLVKGHGKPLVQLRIFAEGPAAGYSFQCDAFSLQEVPIDSSWKTTAKKRIDELRKTNLTITVSSTSARNNVTVQIRQTKHDFPLGTAVASNELLTNAKYRNWYLNNFDWAVLENDLKWHMTEPTKNGFLWSNADRGLNLLQNYSRPVRGHNIFWAAKEYNPVWVQNITDPVTMYNTCMKRIDDLLGRYKGRLVHWDVNNEMIPNSFYSDVYRSQQINYDMFIKSKVKDPTAKLFLNDYEVVAAGERTAAYLNQAKEFLANGAPVEGLGVQGHFQSPEPGPLIWSRLDLLAQAGLPIWVTELDYNTPNNTVRARALEDILTAFFSHPSIHGIMFWGFWDGRHYLGANGAMVNGANFTVNAAGLMWQRLYHTEWRTNVNVNVGSLKPNVAASRTVRAFYGTYTIDAFVNNTKVMSKLISIPKTANPTVIKITF